MIRLEEHMENSLHDSMQSADKRAHSTETALAKTSNIYKLLTITSA